MAHPCGPCGCPLEQGVKIFSIVDMILASLSLILPGLKMLDALKVIEFIPKSLVLIYTVWFLIYLARAVSAFLLFFMGVTKRNVMMCWVWIGVAVGFFGVNFIIACYIWLEYEVIAEAAVGMTLSVYLVYGGWLVYEFIRWIKSGAPAETVTVTAVTAHSSHRSQPPPAYSKSHHSQRP